MDAPKDYTESGFLMLVSGALNIITGGIFFLSLFWICIGFMWLIPMAIGLWQVIVGLAMQKGTPNAQAKMAAMMGAIAGLCNMNPIACIAGFLAYSKVSKPEVAGFLGQA